MKPKRNNTKWVRQTNEENINSLNCELNKLTWETVLNEEDVSKAYDTFISNFTYIFDKCCPMKEVNINKSRLEPKKPWLTTGLVNACHKKNNYQSCIHSAPITHVDESGLFFPKIIQRPQTPPVQMEQAYAMTGHLIADINSTIYRK